MWLLFAGNGAYQRAGPAPVRRHDLADGVLDVRVVHGGRRPAPGCSPRRSPGRSRRSPVHAARRAARLRIGAPAGTPLAFDGEVAAAPAAS